MKLLKKRWKLLLRLTNTNQNEIVCWIFVSKCLTVQWFVSTSISISNGSWLILFSCLLFLCQRRVSSPPWIFFLLLSLSTLRYALINSWFNLMVLFDSSLNWCSSNTWMLLVKRCWIKWVVSSNNNNNWMIVRTSRISSLFWIACSAQDFFFN